MNTNIVDKVVMFLGDSGVGKSSIIEQYLELEKEDFKRSRITNQQKEREKTLCVDYSKVQKKIEDKIYRLNIWDVSGSELEDKVLPKYLLKSVDAFVLTFSLDNVFSLNSLKNWIKLTEKKNLILVKNKSDKKTLNNEAISFFKNDVLKNEIVFESEFEVNYKNFTAIRKLFYSLFEKFSEKKLIQTGSFALNDSLVKLQGNLKNKNCC